MIKILLIYTLYCIWVVCNISDLVLNIAACVTVFTICVLIWVGLRSKPKLRVVIRGFVQGGFQIAPEDESDEQMCQDFAEQCCGLDSFEEAQAFAEGAGWVVVNYAPLPKNTCPECLAPLHPIRSQFIKMCGSCDYQEPWELKEGQKPLITNNRQKG